MRLKLRALGQSLGRAVSRVPGRSYGRIRRPRLRTRVLAGVLAVTLAALVGFDIAAVTGLRHYLIGQTDSQLREVVSAYQTVTPQSVADGQNPGQLRLDTPPPGHRKPPPRWVKAQLPWRPHFVGDSGRLGPHFPPKPASFHLPLLQQFGVTLVVGGRVQPVSPHVSILGHPVSNAIRSIKAAGDYPTPAASDYVRTVPGPPGQAPLRRMVAPYRDAGIIIATTSLGGVDKTVGQLELILIIGSVIAGLLAAGGTAWLVRRGLRPVEAMAGQADKISAGDLTGRVSPHDGRTEVGRLGTALNGMLSRIQDFVVEREASQRAARRFFTDASHELRTPLATLRANAELYLQGALSEREQVDEAMRRIAAEAKRMGGLVDDMLRLARLDQHPERRYDEVDVSALAAECVQQARTAHPGHGWRTDIAPGLATTGDEELLRRAIDNLLANVAAHTPPGSTATVMAAGARDTVTVEVSDDGPGVPDSQLPHIFERFYRGRAPAGRPGSGLGLAIVAAAAAAHYGTVVAAGNEPHGLRVTLILPAVDPDGLAADPDGLAADPDRLAVDPDGLAREQPGAGLPAGCEPATQAEPEAVTR
jgi:two-component system OmpR family sensor kinase